MNLVTIVTLLLSICGRTVYGQLKEASTWERDKFKEEASQTFNLVLHKYNPRIRPPRAYINIEMMISLSHIRHFDTRKQELQTVLDIDTKWYDGRLEWTASKVHQIIVNDSIIWTPDIVIMNAVAPARSIFPSALKISSQGQVRWTRKEEVTTFCMTEDQDMSEPHNCTISLGFHSNVKNDQSDRFFTNTSSFSISDDFSNHEWDVVSFDLVQGERDDTAGHTTDLTINLELKQKVSANGKLDTAPNSDTTSRVCPQTYSQVNNSGSSHWPPVVTLGLLLLFNILTGGQGSVHR